jgi:hypothetical protein
MFILFFGTRPGKSRLKLLDGVCCSYCGQKDTLTAIITPNYFHLFWLPIFVVSKFIMAECSHCKRSYYKEEFSGEMKRALDL